MALDPQTRELWLREFELNGFVILRGFLEVDYVRALHDELSPLLQAEYAKAVAAGWSQGRGEGRMALRLESYAELMRGALNDDRYRRNPVIEELVDALLGAGGWKRGWTQVEVAWKGSDHMTWHPDQTREETPDLDAPHETVRVTYNIPLVDFTWANGSMEVVPGSHRLPRRFHEGEIYALPRIYHTALDLRLGDVVLRDGNGLHRGTPNLTDRARPMLDQTYKRT